jgi:hypothetical protein
LKDKPYKFVIQKKGKALTIETDKILSVASGDPSKKFKAKKVLISHISNGKPIEEERDTFLHNFSYHDS